LQKNSAGQKSVFVIDVFFYDFIRIAIKNWCRMAGMVCAQVGQIIHQLMHTRNGDKIGYTQSYPHYPQKIEENFAVHTINFILFSMEICI
jgi:hypothetical protein